MAKCWMAVCYTQSWSMAIICLHKYLTSYCNDVLKDG